MLAGIEEILIISTSYDTLRLEVLLVDGSQFGIFLSYCVQPSPDGLAQAFIFGEEFPGEEAVAMVLGDNIFYGNGFWTLLKSAVKDAEENGRVTVFGYYISDLEYFSVVELDEDGKALSIEEMPKNSKSNYTLIDLYFYPTSVSDRANKVQPSARRKLEITTFSEMYMNDGLLDVQFLGRGFAWLNTGTMSSLLQVAHFVETPVKTGNRHQRAERDSYINKQFY